MTTSTCNIIKGFVDEITKISIIIAFATLTYLVSAQLGEPEVRGCHEEPELLPLGADPVCAARRQEAVEVPDPVAAERVPVHQNADHAVTLSVNERTWCL